MAKKKNYPAILGSYEPPARSDNNPASGLCDLPNTSIKGYGYNQGENRKFLGDRIAEGGSPIAPNVCVQNVDGTNYAFCEGNNYEWDGDKNSSGQWNKNKPWPGGFRGGE